MTLRGNCCYLLTDWVPIDMVLISRRNITSLPFEIDLNDISNNIRCKHPKERHNSSNFPMIHTRKVLIILNQWVRICMVYIPSLNKAIEVWNELWQMRTSKTNDSAPQTFIKFQRSYFSNKWGNIDIVLIPSKNETGFPSEKDL
jgi:hypothetical protein